MKISCKTCFSTMHAKIRDKNITDRKCGYLGSYYLKNVGLLTLHLGMLKIVTKSLQLSSIQSNVILWFRDFESMHFKLKSPFKATKGK